jgi:hypothetical protein
MIPVARAELGLSDGTVYMTQWAGRGAIAFVFTRIICVYCRVSKFRSVRLTAAFARSFPWMIVWPLSACRVVVRPANLIVS